MNESSGQTPIFIIGAHKSGGSYLRSLLDGHQELAVVPLESHFFKHLGYWVSYRYRRSYRNKLSFRQSVVDGMKFYKQDNNPYSDFTDTDRLKLKAFEKSLSKDLDEKSEAEKFNQYMRAILTSLDVTISGQQRFVEKSVENAEFVADINRIFPQAKFVHIVRNPYHNLASFRRYRLKLEGRYPILGPILSSLVSHHYHLEKNRRNTDNYLVVRYEDLVENTKKELKDICKFLDINFDQRTLKTTSAGKDWSGNSTNNLSKAPSDLSEYEIYLTNLYLGHAIDSLGYKRLYAKKSSYWKRNPKEKLSTYVKNRSIRSIL